MPDIIDNVKTGQYIKELLKKHTMTQEDLANRLSISKSAVSQNLNGKSSFDLQNLKKIASLFNVSIDQLLSHHEQENKEVISEYERVVKKGLDEIKRVPAENLHIQEPDLYGKVLIEYIIEYQNKTMFQYLFEHQVPLFHEYHHQAKTIYLKMILFMLNQDIQGVDTCVFAYVRLHGSFVMHDALLAEKIWRGLNQEKYRVLIQTLMVSDVKMDHKGNPLMPRKRSLKILTKEAWLDAIGTYQLNHVLTTFMSIFTPISNLYITTLKLVELNYLEGLHASIDSVPSLETISVDPQKLHLQETIFKIAETNDIALFAKYLKKHIYYHLDALISKLISENRKEHYTLALTLKGNTIDYRQIGLATVKAGNTELLNTFMTRLTADDKNYLLAQAPIDSYDLLVYLIKEGAAFEVKYYNALTTRKINSLLKHLTKGAL